MEKDKIIDDITNFKTFTNETILHINRLPFEDRLQILFAYNEMSIYYNELLFKLINL
jgi:hypothetical protein